MSTVDHESAFQILDGACAAIEAAADVNGIREAAASGERAVASLPPAAKTALARVTAIALERAALRERIGASTSSREVLVAGIAHDLRNPLNTFAMSAGLLRDDMERGDIEPSRELGLVKRMDRAIERMQRLIEDLVDASRIEANKIQLTKKPLAAAELVSTAVATAIPIAHDRGVTVSVGTLNIASRVVADSSRALQILAKAIAVCVRSTGEGGTIQVSNEPKGTSILFTVRAMTGTNAPIATPDEGRGGLALLIARGLVTLHGGTLSVDGGESLVVSFTLPAS